MFVLYLDICVVDGKKFLLFGFYVGFFIKFLCYGLFFDLLLLVCLGNILLMFLVVCDNMDLICYLIGQVMQLLEQCLEVLCKFYFEVRVEDWCLEVVGQCVQIIKKDLKKGGILQFGIELVVVYDGFIVVLLGVLLGVLVIVLIMFGLIECCFLEQVCLLEWSVKLKEIFLVCEKELESDVELYCSVSSCCSEVLELIVKNDVQVLVNVE